MRLCLRLARDLENGQIARVAVQRWLRPSRIVRGSQIHEARGQVLSCHLVVVAGCARPFQRIPESDGIDMSHVAQPELPEHEDVCPTRHRGTKLFLGAVACFFPGLET